MTIRTYLSLLATALCLTLIGAGACSRDEMPRLRVLGDDTLELAGESWTVHIDPARLEIGGRLAGTDDVWILAGREPDVPAENVSGLSISDGVVAWELVERGLTFSARLQQDVLAIRVTANREQVLKWPVTGTGAESRAAIVPASEGLYVPLDDDFWSEQLHGQCRQLWNDHLPFWGLDNGTGTLAYWLNDELRSHVCWNTSDRNRLTLTMAHEFLERDGLPPLDLFIGLTPHSPIGPALVYRRFLIEDGRFFSLADKVARNPDVAALVGAMHGYLWGDGRTPEAIRDLSGLDVERAFLSYDQDPGDEILVGPETIAAARSFGYLIGPYDTLNNIQHPDRADAASSIFDVDLFETGGVMKKDGQRAGGFRDRGHHLSSEALKRAERDFLAERVDAALRDGVSAYFLDVDAEGELYDDFDPDHPMTHAVDRKNRLERMRFLTDSRGMVLGSESSAGWAAPAIHVSHGTVTPKHRRFWEVLRDRKLVGGYWPPQRPRVHFQTVDAPDDLAALTFDARYRLPLFEAVFHDSVVATDHWGIPLLKFGNVVRERTLLLLLYNVPTIWHLDRKLMRDEGPRISALNAFFAPLHRRLAHEPLTGFEWLTDDRQVQCTRFGDVATLTANFGSEPHEDLPAMCIVAELLLEGTREIHCPRGD